ncbi:MAG: hypothetical protein HGA43_07560 [Nitrospirae bacterium]|nr:hypothetical protein [Nitrospirota bacterium]
MPKSAYKMPLVFVACPYDEKKFKFSAFKKELETLPLSLTYANTTLETKQLLDKIKRLIRVADFSFFDLSMWNSNVALELGLADGIKTDYYILVNGKLDKDVPSDIKGIQRIHYSSLNGAHDSLRDQVMQYFFKKKYPLTRDFWRKISRHRNAAKMVDFGLRVLSFLRDHDAVSSSEFAALAKGLRLRAPDRTVSIDALVELRAMSKSRRIDEYQLRKDIYKR